MLEDVEEAKECIFRYLKVKNEKELLEKFDSFKDFWRTVYSEMYEIAEVFTYLDYEDYKFRWLASAQRISWIDIILKFGSIKNFINYASRIAMIFQNKFLILEVIAELEECFSR